MLILDMLCAEWPALRHDHHADINVPPCWNEFACRILCVEVGRQYIRQYITRNCVGYQQQMGNNVYQGYHTILVPGIV